MQQRQKPSTLFQSKLNFIPTPKRQTPDNYIYSVLLSFVPAASVFIITSLIGVTSEQIGLFLYILMVYGLFILSNVISYINLSSIMDFSIYWRSSLLTNSFLVGFMIANQELYPSTVCFGNYLMCLSFFHLSEFVTTALYNQSEVSTDSFLINHSWEYGLAMLVSWLEFSIEAFCVPWLKTNLYVRFFGLFLVMFGETFRKLAMYTAGTNFNHYVQDRRKTDHVLVKTGVYSFVRHPSYFGWFYWSIGTQILLANPVCTLLYAVSSWKFFKTRISYEEFHLIKFFGKEYIDFQKRVPTGIPFVKGYILYGEESLD